MADKRVSKKTKKKIINQRGGFLPLVLAPVLGVVGSLVGDLIAKAV